MEKLNYIKLEKIPKRKMYNLIVQLKGGGASIGFHDGMDVIVVVNSLRMLANRLEEDFNNRHKDFDKRKDFNNYIRFNCSLYRRISVQQPDHCYNCGMRDGYPQNLGGDKQCSNFNQGDRK